MSYVGAETVTADTWIEAQLAANASFVSAVGARVYSDLAPSTVNTYPFVVYQLQDGTDVTGLGATRIMTNCLYVVKVAGQTTTYNNTLLKNVATYIDDALITEVGGSVAAGSCYGCTRESQFRLTEVVNGVQLRWLGGIYRLWVQGAA